MALYPLLTNPRGTLEYPIETSELPDNVGFFALWPSVLIKQDCKGFQSNRVSNKVEMKFKLILVVTIFRSYFAKKKVEMKFKLILEITFFGKI